MGEVVFEVLGSIRVQRDGCIVDLGGRRARSILVRLLIAGGRPVSTDLLVADLWPESLQSQALPLLQAQISTLRRALEPGRRRRSPAAVLVTEPPGYALHVRVADVALASAAVDAADGFASAGHHGRAAGSYAEALAVWRGDAYAEFADEPWARAEAARLGRWRVGIEERQARSLLADGQVDAAIAASQALVECEPVVEEGWRVLASALYAAGRQADALDALQRVRRNLRDELGLDPGPELRRLEADILSHSPDLLLPPAGMRGAVHPAPVVSAPVGPTDWHGFIGREDELRVLDQLAARAAQHTLVTAVVEAEAGGGKSSLLDQQARIAREAGWAVCAVSCNDAPAPHGWSWVSAARSLAVQHPPSAALIIGWMDEAEPVADGDPLLSRYKLHHALGEWFASIAAACPLLVVIDDAQWADDETAAILVDLLARLERCAVLVVVAHRPEPSTPLRRLLGSIARRTPVRIGLDGLTGATAASFIAAISPGGVGDHDVAEVVRRSGGNPFLLGELARLLASGARLDEVPAGVRDVVRQRVARLPAPAQTVLRIAGLIGFETSVSVLLDVAGRLHDDEEALIDALELTTMFGFIAEVDGGRVRFTHALVRDAIAEDVSGMRAVRWHGWIADALVLHAPNDVIAIATHSAAAGPAQAARTVASAAAAARQAEQRFAHAAAAGWWALAARALEAQGGDPGIGDGTRSDIDSVDGSRRDATLAELIAAEVRCLQLAGAIARSRVLRAEGLAVIDPSTSAGPAATLLVAADAPIVWSPRAFAPPEPQMIAIAFDLAARLEPDSGLRARVLSTVAAELEGNPDRRGYDASLEALHIAERLQDPDVLAHALHARYLHTYRDGVGGVAERGAIGRRLLEVATVSGLGPFEVAAHLVLVQWAAARNDFTVADDHAADARRLADRYGLDLLGALARWYGAMRHSIAGRWVDAEAEYRSANDEIESTGYAGHASLLLSLMFMHLGAGHTDQAAGLVDTMSSLSGHPSGGAADELIALGLHLTHRTEQANVWIGAVHDISPDFTASLAWAIRGLLGVAINDHQRINTAWSALLPYSGMLCGALTASTTLGPVDTILAKLALRRNDAQVAQRLRDRAVQLATTFGNQRWVAEAQSALN